MSSADYSRKRRRRLKRLGLCADCGHEMRSKGHVLGDVCLAYRRAKWLELYKLKRMGL
jgi:hypothetical protein